MNYSFFLQVCPTCKLISSASLGTNRQASHLLFTSVAVSILFFCTTIGRFLQLVGRNTFAFYNQKAGILLLFRISTYFFQSQIKQPISRGCKVGTALIGNFLLLAQTYLNFYQNLQPDTKASFQTLGRVSNFNQGFCLLFKCISWPILVLCSTLVT